MRKLKRRWNTISEAKLVKFVEINPGLTASMIAILWRRDAGTMSGYLHNLAVAGKIERHLGHGMRGGDAKAWRYYENVCKTAVDAVLATMV